MKITRADWTSASFLAYTGALMALLAAVAWLSVISADHSSGAFAGWSLLFFVVAEAAAVTLLARGRPVAAGLFAFVAVVLFAVMVGAFFQWFGWLHTGSGPFSGFHLGVLALELLTLIAAFSALGLFRFPLLVAIIAGVGWYFVTDVLSSGGNWSATVTLLVGLMLLMAGLALDSGDSRPYGFWVQMTAGLTIGGALLFWWHSSDFEWALIIVASLFFILIGAGARRSSYAFLGVIGLVLATGHYSLGESFAIGDGAPSAPTKWAGPVAYLCLGIFLAVLGTLLHRRRAAAEPA